MGGRGWQAEHIKSHPISTYIEMRGIHIEQSTYMYNVYIHIQLLGGGTQLLIRLLQRVGGGGGGGGGGGQIF